MNIVQWLNSLDELLYEFMGWLVFFPLTLWRTIIRPETTLKYAEDQLKLPQEEQYRGTVSPPIMLILSILVSQAIGLAVDGTNPILSSKRGLAGLVNDNTTLLLLRIFLFGIFAVVAATYKVKRSGLVLDRDTLKPPFYAQCYAVAPLALIMGIGTVCAGHSFQYVRHLGAILVVGSLLIYGTTQIRWLKRELGQSLLRSTLDASLIMIISLFCFVTIGMVFVI